MRRITYSLVVVYSGIAIPSDTRTLQLHAGEDCEAYLTTIPWEFAPDFVEDQALGRALLGSTFSLQGGYGPLDARLENARAEVLKELKAAIGEAVALVTKAIEPQPLPVGDLVGKFPNYDVFMRHENPSIDGPLKYFGKVKTALLATVPNAPSYGPRTSRCVYFSAENKKTFFVGFSISAELNVRTMFTDSSLAKFQNKFRCVLDLPNVLRLVADSQLKRKSHVESFLLAWPAMETIVNARSGAHFNNLIASIGQHVGEPLRQVTNKAFDVLNSNNRLGLTEKFTLLAHAEYPAEALQHIVDFKALKEARDKIAHGRLVSISNDHVASTLALIAKYVIVRE